MAEGAVELRIKAIKVFISGEEVEGIKEFAFTPKDSENIKPIKNWTKKTVAVSITEDYDYEGELALLTSSKTNARLLEIAQTKTAVQIVVTAEDPNVVGFKTVTMDQTYFFHPEVKPDAEGLQLVWKFWGTGYKMER